MRCYYGEDHSTLTLQEIIFQVSKADVYARLWKRIQSNGEKSLCRAEMSKCLDIFLHNDNLVAISMYIQ